MTKKAASSMANPVLLKPVDKAEGLIQVIIETPKGSRNKFAFDVKQNIFTVKKVLPAGMSFPYDFGFLPKTLAPEPTTTPFPMVGCRLPSSLPVPPRVTP